jgi:hypothetical protein
MSSENEKTSGRDPATGKFLPGNREGRGNPFLAEQNKFRAAVFRNIREGDVDEITRSLIEQAKQATSDGLRAKALFFEIIGAKVKQVEAKVEGENVKLYVGVDCDQV